MTAEDSIDTIDWSQLETWLFQDHQIITSKWLSWKLNISTKKAIEILNETFKKWSSLESTFLVIGHKFISFNVNDQEDLISQVGFSCNPFDRETQLLTKVISLVSKDKLEDEMKRFHDTISCRIYSIASRPFQDYSKIAASNMNVTLEKLSKITLSKKNQVTENKTSLSKPSSGLGSIGSLTSSTKLTSSKQSDSISSNALNPQVKGKSLQEKVYFPKAVKESPKDVPLAKVPEKEQGILNAEIVAAFHSDDDDVPGTNRKGHKKGRNLIDDSDHESIGEDLSFKSEEMELCENEPMIVIEEESRHETLLPSKRKRTKLIKVPKQTFVNGYLVTEMVTEEVSASDSEVSSINEKPLKAVTTTTSLKGTKSLEEKKHEKKGQGSLLSFFQKK